MKIKITADSTCDLPQHIIDAYDIRLASLHVILGEQSYADRLEMNPERMFEYMEDSKHTCRTSAVNVAEYQHLFSQYQDYDAIIHISISSNFSSSYNHAMQAARDFSNVYVVDSQSVSGGSGMVAEKAVQLARAGMDAPEIVRQLQELSSKVEGSVMLNTLEYVKRGGRCSALLESAASLLQIKIILDVTNGLVRVGKKYHGTFARCLRKFLADRLQNLKDIDDEIVYFATSTLEPALKAEIRAIVEQLGYFKRIVDVEAGCVISCHSGPCAFGIFVVRK